MQARILLGLALALFGGTVQAGDGAAQPEQYICVANRLSGFEYKDETKLWGPMHSRSDRKYAITAVTDRDVRYTVTDVDQNTALGFCKAGFDEAGRLYCDLIGGELKLNKHNGRFLLSHLVGYYDVGSSPDITDETSDMPLIEIGKCSRF
ncbi:MAG TPA: hypothetical protein VFS39_07525 [Nitrospira sp.]|nr:hypothetical protein [Nitrospira sp.]